MDISLVCSAIIYSLEILVDFILSIKKRPRTSRVQFNIVWKWRLQMRYASDAHVT